MYVLRSIILYPRIQKVKKLYPTNFPINTLNLLAGRQDNRGHVPSLPPYFCAPSFFYLPPSLFSLLSSPWVEPSSKARQSIDGENNHLLRTTWALLFVQILWLRGLPEVEWMPDRTLWAEWVPKLFGCDFTMAMTTRQSAKTSTDPGYIEMVQYHSNITHFNRVWRCYTRRILRQLL